MFRKQCRESLSSTNILQLSSHSEESVTTANEEHSSQVLWEEPFLEQWQLFEMAWQVHFLSEAFRR